MSTPEIQTVTLERMSFMAQVIFDKYRLKYFATSAELEVEFDHALQRLLFMIRQDVASEKLNMVEVVWPRDWRQAFKARWFPEWAKRRWPVRYSKIVVEVRALFPALPLREYAYFRHLSILQDDIPLGIQGEMGLITLPEREG